MPIKSDTIAEYTAGAGVTIDGVLIKDGLINGIGANIGKGIYNVVDYGATGDGATDDTAALNAAWAALPSYGAILDMPPGVYLVSDTLAWQSKTSPTIRADGAIIRTKAGSDFTGKPLVNCAGMWFARVGGLQIESTLTGATKPAVGLVLGRITAGDGAKILFENFWVSGYYSVASLYDIGSECNTFVHCELRSSTAAPIYLTSSEDDEDFCNQTGVSNTRKVFYGCNLTNWGNDPCRLVELRGLTKDVAFRDCYMYMPAGSHCFHLTGTSSSTYGLLIDNLLVEGIDDADSRLLYTDQDNPCAGMTLQAIRWTVVSDYLLETTAYSIIYSKLDMTYWLAIGTKAWLADGETYGNIIFGRGEAMIEVPSGAYFEANQLIWMSAATPFTGAGYYGTMGRDDNLLSRAYIFNSESSGATRRMYTMALDSDTTPSVAGKSLIYLVYSSPATLTNFTDAIPGQEVTLIAGTNNNVTIQHNNDIRLSSEDDWQLPVGSTLTLVYSDFLGKWYEKSRMSSA